MSAQSLVRALCGSLQPSVTTRLASDVSRSLTSCGFAVISFSPSDLRPATTFGATSGSGFVPRATARSLRPRFEELVEVSRCNDAFGGAVFANKDDVGRWSFSLCHARKTERCDCQNDDYTCEGEHSGAIVHARSEESMKLYTSTRENPKAGRQTS